jgi:hypothetical protein
MKEKIKTTVIRKKVGRPNLAEVDTLFSDSRKFARHAGLKKSGIKKAIRLSRASR